MNKAPGMFRKFVPIFTQRIDSDYFNNIPLCVDIHVINMPQNVPFFFENPTN
jgi:hypothetical protein